RAGRDRRGRAAVQGVLEAIVAGLIGLGWLATVLGPTLWVALVPSPSDVSRIKAEYEGLQGRAGPNTQVLNVRRTGVGMGNRSEQSARVYELTLRKFDGEVVKRSVVVEFSVFGDGRVREGW